MVSSQIFQLPDDYPFKEYFKPDMLPWKWIENIQIALATFDFRNQGLEKIPANVSVGENVFIHPTVKLPHCCTIEGPTYIGPHTEIRPNAYIRGNLITGKYCILGNSCEYKNSLLLDKAYSLHFNYIGDSILGNNVNMGAGSICANLKFDKNSVEVIDSDGNRINSAMIKLGAMVGDNSQIGCNAVLQPGTIIGRNACVTPNTAFHGYLPDNYIAFSDNKFQKANWNLVK